MTGAFTFKLCPIPGIPTITCLLVDKRTLATFRTAEFGFFDLLYKL